MENYNELLGSLSSLREELESAKTPFEKLRIHMALGLTYLLLSDYENERENILSGLVEFDEAEKIAKSIPDNNELAEIESNKGFVFYKLAHIEDSIHNLDVASQHYLNALDILKDTDESQKKVRLYYNLANTYLLSNDISKVKDALTYFEKALELKDKTEDKKIIGLIYHGMGVVNFSLGKLEQNVQKRQEYFENAAKNFEESLNYFDPDDLLDIASSKSHLGSSLIEIAILTGKKELFDKALENYNAVLEIYKGESDEDYATVLFDIGLLYLNESRLQNLQDDERITFLQKAIDYFEQALPYFPKEDHKGSFIRINYELASCFRELFFVTNKVELLEEIKEHLEGVIDDIDKNNNPYTYLTSSFYLGEAYFYTGNKEKALEYYEDALDTAKSFDSVLADSIKDVVDRVKSL